MVTFISPEDPNKYKKDAEKPIPKGKLSDRAVTSNPSFGEKVAKVATLFFATVFFPVTLVAILPRYRPLEFGGALDNLATRVMKALGVVSLKQTWSSLLESKGLKDANKEKIKGAFNALGTFLKNPVDKNLLDLEKKLKDLPAEVKALLKGDSKLFFGKKYDAKFKSNLGKLNAVLIGDIYESNSDKLNAALIGDMDDEDYVSGETSPIPEEIEKAWESVKESQEFFKAIKEFSSDATRSNFQRLQSALKTLSPEDKKSLAQNDLRSVLGDQCIQNCADNNFPLFLLETALNPNPQAMNDFLNRLVHHASRDEIINQLKAKVLDEDISQEDRSYLAEKGCEPPRGITYKQLSEILNYIHDFNHEGLKELIGAFIQEKGIATLESERSVLLDAIKAGFKDKGNEIDTQIEQEGLTRIASEINNKTYMEEKIIRDFIQASGIHYPIIFNQGVPLRCFNNKEDFEKLKGEVDKFVLNKGENLNTAVLFCCTQHMQNVLMGSVVDTYEVSAFPYLKDQKVVITSKEDKNFTVTVECTYLYQAPLQDRSLLDEEPSFTTIEDVQRVRKELDQAPIQLVAQIDSELVLNFTVDDNGVITIKDNSIKHRHQLVP